MLEGLVQLMYMGAGRASTAELDGCWKGHYS